MDKVVVSIETTCNVSDKQLRANLEATKARDGIYADFTADIRSYPILICGSGPSLVRCIGPAREMYPTARIMALNGAYKTLLDMGIVADYYIQLDARPENVNFVKHPDSKTAFLLASQCAPEMFQALKDMRVWVYHLNTPSTKKVFEGEKIYFGGSGTIGPTAMGVAAAMGYRTMGLLGYDSSYEGEKSHANFQPQNKDQVTMPIYLGEKEYRTTPAMAEQVKDFRPWCKGLEAVFPGLDIRLMGQGLLYDYIVHGQSHEASREFELAKYVELYKDPTYGMSDYRANTVVELLRTRPRGTLLDVGAGRGETIEIARTLGYVASGTETVPALLGKGVVEGILPDLPLPDRAYDTVTCFEVLEHLVAADIVPALRELERVAKDRVIISVCTASDMRGGVECHPSYMPESQWVARMRAAWGIEADLQKVGDVSVSGVSPVYEYRLRS